LQGRLAPKAGEGRADEKKADPSDQRLVSEAAGYPGSVLLKRNRGIFVPIRQRCLSQRRLRRAPPLAGAGVSHRPEPDAWPLASDNRNEPPCRV
jgi:hypothetical protein